MKYMGETVWHATVRFTGSFDFVLGGGRRGWGYRRYCILNLFTFLFIGL